jgi:hypothetical protein
MKIPIYHMASMARSGETLLQRQLNTHTKIRIAHNLNKGDKFYEQLLYKHLKKRKNQLISSKHLYALPYRFKKDEVILLKQGVWEHKHPFKGFILSRNPLSIYASLKVYDDGDKSLQGKNAWHYNEQRLIRWMYNIDSKLINNLTGLSQIDQFSLFYNRRMGGLIETGLPVVFYENFVQKPRDELKKILSYLNLEYEPQVIDAHKKFSNSDIGHGNIKLSRPIDTSSIYKYKDILTNDEISEISEKVKEVAFEYGYKNDE